MAAISFDSAGHLQATSIRTRPVRESTLLTEAEIQKNFVKLIKNRDADASALDKAENLLDELRLESPLRHRLETELDEIRKFATS